MSNGSGFSMNDGRGAAEGNAGGPQMAPGKGPTNRTDIIIAAAVVVAVAGGVLALVLS